MTKTIYFNRTKALLQLFAGIAIILGAVIIVRGIFGILLFFVGGSFIFFARKAISKKPQLIISDESLFVGFKFNKTISWRNIQKAEVVEKEVDWRRLKFLELYLRIQSNGPSNILKREFLLENLDTDPKEINRLIQEKLSGSSIPYGVSN